MVGCPGIGTRRGRGGGCPGMDVGYSLRLAPDQPWIAPCPRRGAQEPAYQSLVLQLGCSITGKVRVCFSTRREAAPTLRRCPRGVVFPMDNFSMSLLAQDA